jgi:outer membrane protein TolC
MRTRTTLLAGVSVAVLTTSAAWAVDAPETSGASLRLEDAVRLALTRNERSKVSDLNVVVAEAAVEKARAAFLPALTAQASDVQHAYDATEKSPNNIAQASVTVSQSLLNAPAFPLYSQTRHLEDAQHAQNVDDKRILAFNAASAFFAVLNAQDVLRAAERQLENARANLQNTQARAEAQLTSTNDVTRAQVDMASSAREVEIDKGTLGSAFVQLAFTINAPVPASVEPPSAMLALAQKGPGPVDALVRFAIEHRPDLQAGKYQAAAAHAFAGEPLLRLLPSLSLQGQATATSNPPVPGRWNDETLQAVLSWSLYDQGVRYADKHSRDAQAAIADLNLQQLGRNIDAQVRSAALALAAAQAALRVAQDAANAARQSVEETAILYRQGLAKAIELVDANDQRFAAETNYATAQYAVAQAHLNLRQALGLDPLGTESP